jgi:thiamine pyrophosphate-dependent acetolactate synthase large subunit-like protein
VKLHAALARALHDDHGIDTLFGLICDANLYLVDRYIRDEGGSFIATANECGSVMGAYGYARRSGRLGAATVTHGPGLTNTVTSLVEAVRSRTPLLVLCGDTPAGARENLQKIDQREIVTSTGAGFEQVTSAASALKELAIAVRRAILERRPVVCNVPIDFMWEEVEYERHQSAVAADRVAPDPDALDAALGVIASAQRPVIVVGRGVDEAGVVDIQRLAERIGAPVATTLGAKGILHDDPFLLGVFGTLSTSVALDTILAADCVIAFGASLNRWTTAEGSLLRDKAVVHCDADRASIGRFEKVDAGIVGDASTTAKAMLAVLEEAGVTNTGTRSPELVEALRGFSRKYADRSTETTVDIRTALSRINDVVSEDRSVVCDLGRFIHQPFKLLDVARPRGITYTIAFGSIGLGLGAAIGVACAAPDSPVLFVAGDGGFMNSGVAEFNTAVRHNLDLIVVICNDSAYGAEHIQFRRKEMDPAISVFEWPEFADVAESLGGRGVTVRNLADLDNVEKAIRERDRPLLIDLKLDPDQVAEATNDE